MSNVVLINNIIASKILNIRNKQVILDSDVAELYGVETKHINQAISRNIDKFPEGYVITLNKIEWDMVKSQIVTSPNLFGGGKVKTPKVFTEKGLYMLATILKSSEATATTIAIIETFAAVREIKREVISVFKAAD